MIIIFANKKLREFANDNNHAIRKMGSKRAELYLRRIDDLANAGSFAELEHLPGRFHPLTQNRKGQWACDLDHPYRLIFEPREVPSSFDIFDKIGWNKIKCVVIIEITDYH